MCSPWARCSALCGPLSDQLHVSRVRVAAASPDPRAAARASLGHPHNRPVELVYTLQATQAPHKRPPITLVRARLAARAITLRAESPHTGVRGTSLQRILAAPDLYTMPGPRSPGTSGMHPIIRRDGNGRPRAAGSSRVVAQGQDHVVDPGAAGADQLDRHHCGGGYARGAGAAMLVGPRREGVGQAVRVCGRAHFRRRRGSQLRRARSDTPQ